jgi:S1-C subfamily serine protease
MKVCLVSVLILFIMSATAMPDPTATAECTEPIPTLFQRASPSVVFISAIIIDPFRVTNRVSSCIGSGFIVNTEGLVLANSHVVFGSRAVTVTLDDGSTVPAELLGAGPARRPDPL